MIYQTASELEGKLLCVGRNGLIPTHPSATGRWNLDQDDLIMVTHVNEDQSILWAMTSFGLHRFYVAEVVTRCWTVA